MAHKDRQPGQLVHMRSGYQLNSISGYAPLKSISDFLLTFHFRWCLC